MSNQEFDELMAKMCEGDKNALHAIYNEYLPYVYSVVKNVVQSKEDAEDITSEFFIKLWTNSSQYRAGNGHKAFLATTARNMAIDYLRKHKKEILSDFENSTDDDENYHASLEPAVSVTGAVTHGDNNPNESEEVLINSMTLRDAIQTLKVHEREVVNMKIMSMMTFKEIADCMGKPMGTITWWYKEAIEKLRRCGYESKS